MKVLLLSSRADAASRIAADGWEVSLVKPSEIDVAAAAAAHRVAVVDLESAPESLDVAVAMRAANGSLEFVALAADERGAVDAVRRGAFDAIPWPEDPIEARLMIEAAMRATAAPSSEENGIGEYVFRKRLAVGGMAEVFLADSPKRKGYVVVKCLLPSLAKDPEFVEMFGVEARMSAKLVHPNVVRVVDFGASGDRLFIALEHVDGWDLDKIGVAARWRFPPAIACHVIAELCRGLGYAHARGDERGEPLALVHRDVNPPNVLVSRDGHVRLSDFGIAKSSLSTIQTQHGIIKGKVDWFSPEQIDGTQTLDGRSDIFSAGAILYLLLTGTHPFRGFTRSHTMNRIRDAEVVPPSNVRAGLPEALDPILAKALARDREDRYRRADDLESALRSVIDALGGATREEVARFVIDAMGSAGVRAEEATVLSPPPRAPSDATPIGPSVMPRIPPSEIPTITPAARGIPPEEPTIMRPAPPSRSWLPIAALITIPALVGIALGVLTRDEEPAPRARITPRVTAAATRIAVATPTIAPTRVATATPTEIATQTPKAAPVRTATPAPTRIAAVPKNGTLSVWMAEGWAAISVDGKSLGLNAPRVGIPIPEGRHRVTLENPAKGFRRDYDVTIVAGKESRLQVTIPPNN